MKSSIELSELLAAIIRSENEVSQIESDLAERGIAAKIKIAELETVQIEKWAEIKAHMEETGEYEIILSGSATNYKICYSAQRESVKVSDPNAVPDEWVKTERKPKLKEIGDYLKALREAGQPLPNWANLELSEKRVSWKAVKK